MNTILSKSGNTFFNSLITSSIVSLFSTGKCQYLCLVTCHTHEQKQHSSIYWFRVGKIRTNCILNRDDVEKGSLTLSEINEINKRKKRIFRKAHGVCTFDDLIDIGMLKRENCIIDENNNAVRIKSNVMVDANAEHRMIWDPRIIFYITR